MDKQFARNSVAFLLVAAVLLLFSNYSFACQCVGPQNLGERVASGDVVFVATITSVEDSGSSSRYRQIGYQSTEILKGKTMFPVLQTHRNSCGFPFEVGAEYLVFATKEGKVTACSGTRPTDSADESISQGSMWVKAIRDFNAGVTQDLVAPWYFSGSEDKCILWGEFERSNPAHAAYLILWAPRPNGRNTSTYRILLGFSIETLDENNATDRPVELHIGASKIDIPPAKLRDTRAQIQESRESLDQIAMALRVASTDPGGGSVRFDTGAAPVRMSSDTKGNGAIAQFQDCTNRE
jgi:hypothetical protein